MSRVPEIVCCWGENRNRLDRDRKLRPLLPEIAPSCRCLTGRLPGRRGLSGVVKIVYLDAAKAQNIYQPLLGCGLEIPLYQKLAEQNDGCSSGVC